MKHFLIVTACLCAGVAAQAQQGPWSLSQCIDYALEHNLSVQQSALAVEQREVDLSTAKGRRLPGLSASASENLSFGRGLTEDNTYSDNTNTSSTSFTIGGEIPIFQGFDITNGIKIGELNLAAATADLEKARDDIRVAVAQAYVQILYNQELARVAAEQASHDAQLLEQVRERRLAGLVSDAEVSAQQATLAQSRQSQIFDIVVPEVGDPSRALLMRPEAIYDEAVAIKPVVEAARINADAAAVSVARAKGAYLPHLSLSGGIGTNYYTNSSSPIPLPNFGTQLKKNFSQSLGLSLSIPIFQRMSARNGVRTAEINLKGQQIQLENVKKALYKEIQQAYYNAVTAQARYEGSQEAAASARQHYELTEEKYKVGKAGVTDYNDARNNWLRAESEHIQARYQCLYQTKLLDFYRGVALEF